MAIIKKKIQPNFLNILLALYPLVYLLGNFAINLLTAIIIIFAIYIFKGKIIPSDNKNLSLALICFFSYLIIITFFSYWFAEKEVENFLNNFWKSLLYLRYLFLFFIISLMIEKGHLNLKYFYILAASLSFILGADLIVQYNLGVDLFGFEQPEHLGNRRFSGFLGDELIAGGYLFRFCFFGIFIFFIIKSFPKKFGIIFFSVTLIFFLVSIFIAGNRMPLFLFILVLLIFSLVEKKLRKIALTISLCSLICIFAIYKNFSIDKPSGPYTKVEQFAFHIGNFYNNAEEIALRSWDIISGNPEYQHEMVYDDEKKDLFLELTKDKKEFKSGHLKIFNAAFETWKKNKIFGGGLRSFRINFDFKFNVYCAPHAHNYYGEILISMGALGLALFSLIVFLSLFKFLNFYLKTENSFDFRVLLLPFFLVFFAEIFPFRSSGNFFSTFNSTIFFVYLAILTNANKISKPV